VISRAPAQGKGGVCLLLALTRPFLDESPRPLGRYIPISTQRSTAGTVQYSKMRMEGRSGDGREGGR
jgi:hypothetical protein